MRTATWRWALLALPLALGVLAAAKPTPPRPRAELAKAQAAARQWVQRNRARLPKEYDQFSKMPLVYRREIQVALSGHEREILWRAHLNSFVLPAERLSPIQQDTRSQVPSLTDEQRALIDEAIDALPAIFSESLALRQRQAIAKTICDRAKTLFGVVAGSAVFGRLGPRDEGYERLIKPKSRQASLVPLAVLGKFAAAVQAEDSRCTCAQDSWCDCNPYTCSSYMCVMTDTPSCGCFNIWSCNGNCTY